MHTIFMKVEESFLFQMLMSVPVIHVTMRAIALILLTCTTVLVTLGGQVMYVTKVMHFRSWVAAGYY